MKATTRGVFRVLGAVAAIGGGSAAFLVGTWASLNLGSGTWLLAMALVSAVAGVACGWLLRTWWALLVIPVLFDLGLVGALALLSYQAVGVDPELRAHVASYLIGILVLPVLYLPLVYLPLVYLLLVVGTAIGTGVARWLDEQVAQRRLGT
jgi:hypothetical protein